MGELVQISTKSRQPCNVVCEVAHACSVQQPTAHLDGPPRGGGGREALLAVKLRGLLDQDWRQWDERHCLREMGISRVRVTQHPVEAHPGKQLAFREELKLHVCTADMLVFGDGAAAHNLKQPSGHNNNQSPASGEFYILAQHIYFVG